MSRLRDMIGTLSLIKKELLDAELRANTTFLRKP